MGNSSMGGKILRVNLTSGKIWTEPTEKYTSDFIGGRGINDWILYNEVKPWVTPFDPANRLIIGTGVLVGTLAPSSCRLSVEAKSPITGGLGSGNAGGHFSPELKYAGYDHIVFEGRARSPVYLWINDDQAQIKDAAHIWGKTTWETDDVLKEEAGDGKIQVACIGPAGENLARAACIIVNRARAIGRCSLGAVMGSKNLKAIAVRGSGSIGIADPPRFMQTIDDAWEKLGKSEKLGFFKDWGTIKYSLGLEKGRPDFWRNFQDAVPPDRVRGIAPEVFRKEYETRRASCFGCPIFCSHYYEIKEGPYAGTICEGFHANDESNFGMKLDIDYAPAIIKAHCLCSKYGLDQDNSANAIAWAFECYQRGIISEGDTDGLQLKWGDHEVLMELLRKIAYREGIGDILAEGAMRASEIIGKGSQDFAIHVKGQDNMEPMRGAKGWALGSVVSTRGGGHLRGANLIERPAYAQGVSTEFCEKTWGVPKIGDPLSYEHKAKPVMYYECFKSIMDILGICIYTTTWEAADLLGPDDMAELYSSATGKDINGDEFMRIGKRIHNIEKAFNVLHVGFSRQDDYPPKRFMEESVKSGPLKGQRLVRNKWDKMLDEYYGYHNWDKKTSWPTRQCLEDLDLKQVADDLEKAGRLGR